MRTICLILLAFAFGCATTDVVVLTAAGDKIHLNKMSVMRRGPYKATVTVPQEKGKVEIHIEGEDKSMSGNLAFLGGVIGGLFGGPTGAAAGSALGTVGDVFKPKIMGENTVNNKLELENP